MSLQSVWQVSFDLFSPSPVVLEPNEAALSSDAGLLLIRQFDEPIGFSQSITLDLCGTRSSRYATGAIVDLVVDRCERESLSEQSALQERDAVSIRTLPTRSETPKQEPAVADQNVSGAFVTVRRQLKGGGSYLSANSRKLVIGLASAERVRRLSVRWPDNTVDEWADLPAGWLIRLKQGDAEPKLLSRHQQ